MFTPIMAAYQRRQAGRLFAALARGERLACLCAQQQSGMIACARSRRFLQAQARQELMHARLFEQAADWLAPGCVDRVPTGLQAFGRRLQCALARGALTESLLASQILLEGAGEQILLRLHQGMNRRNIGFRRLRQRILRQEQSHHTFGLRTLRDHIDRQQLPLVQVHELADSYLQQVRGIFTEMTDVFAALDEDSADYIDGVVTSLPAWLLPERHDLGHHSRAE
jgi:hypothetical protein